MLICIVFAVVGNIFFELLKTINAALKKKILSLNRIPGLKKHQLGNKLFRIFATHHNQLHEARVI